MARETPEQTKQERASEEQAGARKKKSLGTLPKGGMSPLADREDPGAWTAPKAPLGARDVRISPIDDGRSTAPEEPVGGWVDVSTGRGRVRVGGNASALGKPRPREQHRKRTVAVKDKEYPDMAARATSESPRARVKSRTRKLRAVAEAAATERQEEDRNYQDAVKDMRADDEEYDDGDT